ncbi:MAG: dockerin type I domain-containing protein [Phycisphaerales bacterium]|nr:dockerin type I domain-containing protein [Phycisphaerales bacterium]
MLAKPHQTRPTRTPSRKYQHFLESLETRTLLSVAAGTATYNLSGNTLYIDGSNNVDWIEIQETSTQIIVHSFGANRTNETTQSFAKSSITMIDFIGYGGNDVFINAYEGVICSIPCHLDGVSGNNTLTGGNGNDWIYGGTGNSALTPGNGDNIIIGGFGTNTFYNTGTGSNCFVWMGENNQWASGNSIGNDDALLIFSQFDGDGKSINSYYQIPYRTWAVSEVFSVVKNVELTYGIIGTFQYFHVPSVFGDDALYMTIFDFDATRGLLGWSSLGTGIALCDPSAFNLFIHEVAHHWNYSMNPVWNDFRAISWNANGSLRSDAAPQDFNGGYAMTNMMEDWAETVLCVILNHIPENASAKFLQKVAIVNEFLTWLNPNPDKEAHSTVVTTNLDIVNANDGLISLREALRYAKAGDTITFDPSMYGQTIALRYGELTIARNVIIDATGMNITIDANGKSSVMIVGSFGYRGVVVTLAGLTIINGVNGVVSSFSGGGISNYGMLTVTNCTFTNNSVTSSTGGGINNTGTLTAMNCTITNNSGGGISNSGTLTVTNCTITGNSSGGFGGGIYNTGTLTINNTIVAGNLSFYSQKDIYNSGTITGSNNLIGINTGQTALVNGSNGNIVGTASSPINPSFVNAAQGDYRLAAGSPAIDKGSNALIPSGITTDLDGKPRIINGIVDIGAYEYGSVPARLPGDANGDGIVDLADLTILARNWKKPGDWATGDFNGDGFVDLADLTILARNWKKTLGDMAVTDTDGLSWAAALASVTFGEGGASPVLPESTTATITTTPATHAPGPLPLNWNTPRFNNAFSHEAYRADGKNKVETLAWEGFATTATIDELLADTKYTFIVRAVSSTLNIRSANTKISASTVKPQ